MSINYKKILGVSVYTKSQVLLGKISSFELDLENQHIAYYIVKSLNPFRSLFSQKLLIHRSQVVSLSESKMVVDDNVATQSAVVDDVSQNTISKREGEVPTLPSSQ